MKAPTATFLDLARPMLAEVEARMRPDPSEVHPALSEAIDHLLNSGGKRIRPTMVILVGNMLGTERERLITHAAAIEMLHTATLVHDDLIDGSFLRRGIPTLNSQWSPGATVLTGDYLFARAAQLAAAAGNLTLMESFARALMTIVNGEITQLFDQESVDPIRAYFDRIYAKTASLFEVACEGAAILAGSDLETVESMRTFGYHLGQAFQIVDDVLDFTADQLAVGKPVANDLRQGLITLPTILHLEAQPGDLELFSPLSRQMVDDETLEALIEKIKSSGAIELSMDRARQFVSQGEQQLSRLPATPEREALYELAHYVTDRTL